METQNNPPEKANLRLTLDLALSLNGMGMDLIESVLVQQLEETLRRMLDVGIDAVPAKLESFEAHADQVVMLSPDFNNEYNDFILSSSVPGTCWVSVDNMALAIKREREGVVFDVWPLFSADEPVSTMCVFHEDAEWAQLQNYGLAHDEVVDWVRRNLDVDFESSPPKERARMIVQCYDAQKEAQAKVPA